MTAVILVLVSAANVVLAGFAFRRRYQLLVALERVAEVIQLPDDVQEWEESDGTVRVVEVVDAQRVRDAIGETLVGRR